MRFLSLVLVGAITLGSSACVVVSKPGHGHRSSAVSRRDCPPSQHWDGDRCRHNGKGKGARKHDGRR